jgi:peptide subunit release factor 1 (eRF1)
VVGPQDTLEALIKGQVDELLITASLRDLAPSTASDSIEAVLPEPVLETVASGEPAAAGGETVRLADELVTKAAQTGARITFVEDPRLLADVGGVAAILRFVI